MINNIIFISKDNLSEEELVAIDLFLERKEQYIDNIIFLSCSQNDYIIAIGLAEVDGLVYSNDGEGYSYGIGAIIKHDDDWDMEYGNDYGKGYCEGYCEDPDDDIPGTGKGCGNCSEYNSIDGYGFGYENIFEYFNYTDLRNYFYENNMSFILKNNMYSLYL